jgi:hypothetical protein
LKFKPSIEAASDEILVSTDSAFNDPLLKIDTKLIKTLKPSANRSGK